ncbi:MAG: hypothetical protein JSW51_07200 [Gemmatimonadota bacterium]|nr:MAG: hypothetical protein JSW51_07200 [Gemmatimonadota bacterium]
MRGRIVLVMAWFALVGSAVSGRLDAQNRIGLTISLAPIPVQVTETVESESSKLTGIAFGGRGVVTWRKLRLDLRYLEGGLSPEAEAPDEDIVEGELMLGFVPLSWLTLRFGPHIRSFVTNQGTQRWIFWEGHVGGALELGTPRLITYFDLWHVFGANVDAVEEYDSGNGIEGGIRFTLDRLPFWGKLAYRIDHSSLGAGSRSKTVEQMVFAIGWMITR